MRRRPDYVSTCERSTPKLTNIIVSLLVYAPNDYLSISIYGIIAAGTYALRYFSTRFKSYALYIVLNEKVDYSILSLIIKASALIFTLFPFFSVTRINPSSTGTAIKLF